MNSGNSCSPRPATGIRGINISSHATRRRRVIARVSPKLARRRARFMFKIEHHTNPAPVRSPTYAEASRPVYSRAVDNWRHYEEFMGDALGPIEGVLAELGYA